MVINNIYLYSFRVIFIDDGIVIRVKYLNV